MPNTHKLVLERPFQLQNLPTDGKQFHPNRDDAETEFKALRNEFVDLQERLYAEDKQKLLIVFQAMDAGGKDGAIRNVLKGVNPQGVRVQSFKAPSKEDLAHDFLWRIHKVVPARGMIGVFNRSHYEDVLVVRVHNMVPESVWRPRYAQINQFEKLLHDTGTRILKFYLHISAAEQKARFQARLDDPEKHWKFSLEDLEKRKFWPDYMAAYEEMLHECTTEWAPWYVIPANQKWYRNLAVMRTIVHTLREMNPQFPAGVDNLHGVVIE
ncbi:MAG: polyphosphate kinase 2 family protein [Anaerolineaceae bacterium]|nr:polyphosphate kinase 2 family protein [Anaerolineaceae bacterium]